MENTTHSCPNCGPTHLTYVSADIADRDGIRTRIIRTKCWDCEAVIQTDRYTGPTPTPQPKRRPVYSPDRGHDPHLMSRPGGYGSPR